MPFIHLTQKLQKEMGTNPAALVRGQEKCVPFEDWYAHLFFMDRRKHVILVEMQTLFSFVIENVSRKDIRGRFPELYMKGLGRALFNEDVSSAVMSKVMEVCRGELVFAKAESRRTVGAMNEFVKQHKYSREYGSERSVEVRDCLHRHMPMHGFPDGSKAYKFPMDVFARVLKEQLGLDFTPRKHNFFDAPFN